MSQRDDALRSSSFLSGVNASYLEQLQARYEADPGSLDPEWRRFFDGLDDRGADPAGGPSWRRPNWPPLANGEMTAVLDGNWASSRGRSPPRSGPAPRHPSPPRRPGPPCPRRRSAAPRRTACAR